MHVFFIYVFIGKCTERYPFWLSIPRIPFEVHESVVIHVLRHLLRATETHRARWPFGTAQRGCSVLLLSHPHGLLSADLALFIGTLEILEKNRAGGGEGFTGKCCKRVPGSTARAISEFAGQGAPSSGKAWKRREKSRTGRKGKKRARLTFASPPASGIFLKRSYN